MSKGISLGKLLTPEQLKTAYRIMQGGEDTKEVHAELVEKVVKPALPDINRVTGQENNIDYIAYALMAAYLGAHAIAKRLREHDVAVDDEDDTTHPNGEKKAPNGGYYV